MINQHLPLASLSDKHIFNAMNPKYHPDSNKNFLLKVGPKDDFIPDDVYVNAIKSFSKVTELVLTLISFWGDEKDNPKQAYENWSRYQSLINS